jgi:hypothetical protein
VTQVAVVGDDEKVRRPVRAIEQVDVADDREDDGVGCPTAAVPHHDACRDPLVAEAAFGRAIEDEFDRDRGGDRAAQSTDERGRRRRATGL